MSEKKIFCESVTKLDVDSLGLSKDLIERVMNGYGSFANCLAWYRGNAFGGWGVHSYAGCSGMKNLLNKDERELMSRLQEMFDKPEIAQPVDVEEYSIFCDIWVMVNEYDDILMEVFEKNGFIREDFHGNHLSQLEEFLTEVIFKEADKGIFDIWHEIGKINEIYEAIDIEKLDFSRTLEKMKHKLAPRQREMLEAYFESDCDLGSLSAQEEDLLENAKNNFGKLISDSSFWAMNKI